MTTKPHTVERSFVNELGNRIKITIEGPTSTSENILTELEARHLRDAMLVAIPLTPAEIQSGHDRVRWAENLIRQLPEDHQGRNSWLLNYGIGPKPSAPNREPIWTAPAHD